MRHTISQVRQALLASLLLGGAGEAPGVPPVVVLTCWPTVAETGHADA